MSLVPIWPHFVKPVLENLLPVESMKRRALIEASAQSLNLSEEARAETVESGNARYRGRASWAITHCNKAGLIERISRGTYALTDKGQAWLDDNPDGFQTFAAADAYFKPYWPQPEATKAQGAGSEQGTPALVVTEVVTNPAELAEDAVGQLNEDTRRELLERLRESTPAFFEDAVVKLLVAMGYSGTEGRSVVTGQSHDGGIDGVIDGDALGLDQVYVQAKRYSDQNTVGREAVQAFVGALHVHGATKGVFITTSTFSTHAVTYASAVPSRIVLIDGRRLTQLMLKYRVGAQERRTLHVLEVDEDFFE